MNLNIDSFTEVFLGDGAFIPTVADAVVGPSPSPGAGCSAAGHARPGSSWRNSTGNWSNGSGSPKSSKRSSGTR